MTLPPWAWWIIGLLTPVVGATLRGWFLNTRGVYRVWLKGLPPYEWYGLWLILRGWNMLVAAGGKRVEVRSFDGRRWISVDVAGFRDLRDENR